MATPDRPALRVLLARATDPLPAPQWSTASDLARMSREAMARKMDDELSSGQSRGTLRMHREDDGPIALADAGVLQVAWQRGLNSVGAAMTGVRTPRGPLPQRVMQRTEMGFVEHSAGSLSIELQPTQDAADEIEPDGNVTIPGLDTNRALADQAASRLITLLASDPSDEGVLRSELLELGPRVGSAVKGIAQAITAAGCDLSASWEEPTRPTVRVLVDQQGAQVILDVVQGRHLDAEEVTTVGTIHTVSDIKRWDVETESGVVLSMDAGGLNASEVKDVNVGDHVEVTYLEEITLIPDGSTKSSYQITGITTRD